MLDRGGTVLRYTGDEILAVFGAPLATAGHARHALTCAIAMHAAEARLGEQLGELGLPPRGIGVQTGEVVSAVMGSDIRRQYAMVGTPLTLGSRLCSQARTGETLVPAETWNELGAAPPVAEELTLALEGRDEPAVLYRIGARQPASDASRQLR